MADALERWRQGWSGTNRVVAAARIRSVFNEESQAIIEGGGVQVAHTTLRDESGNLTEAVRAAEVLISVGTPMDAEVFAQLPRTRFLLRPYVGYDDLDIDAATEHGILVANVPDTFILEVADHTLTLLLAAQRKLFAMDKFVRDGRWFKGETAREAARPIRRLSTMTLGLVGFGNIARLVAQRAAPFGLRILAHDPFVPADAAAGTGVTLVSMDELLRESDILSIHTFLSKSTRGLINAACFAKMKPTAILVNTARGPIVDEVALIDALEKRQIAGAALDVQEVEPLDPASPLCSLDNVLVAPHYASYSEEGDALHRKRVGDLALQGARGLPERKVVINKGLYDRIVELPEMAGVKRH